MVFHMRRAVVCCLIGICKLILAQETALLHEVQLARSEFKSGEEIYAKWILKNLSDKAVTVLTDGPTYFEVPFQFVRIVNGEPIELMYSGAIGCFGKGVYSTLESGQALVRSYTIPKHCFELSRPGDYEIHSTHRSMRDEKYPQALAGAYKSNSVRFRISVADESVLEEVRDRIRRGDPQAMKAAGAYGDELAIPALRNQASKENDIVFRFACRALAEIDSPTALKALEKIYARMNGLRRAMLAAELAQFPRSGSKPLLELMLRDDYRAADPQLKNHFIYPVRIHASEALNQLGIKTRVVLREGLLPHQSRADAQF